MSDNNDSLLDPIDDDAVIDRRFIDGDTIKGEQAQKDNEETHYYPVPPNDIEILTDQLEDVTEVPLDLGDGDTFEITRKDDPMHDLYPMTIKRPQDLFKEPLYDRQIGESADVYQRFLVFSSLAPAKRTIKQAWREWNRQNDGNMASKPSGPFRDMANHWRWTDRAFSLDLNRNKAIQQIWIEREVARREDDWNAGSELREKAFDALAMLDADDIGSATIAKFFALASDLQEKAVPESGLDTSDLTSILDSLPKDRRDRVIEIVAAKVKIS